MEFGEELKEIGLTNNEAKAYTALIEHGKLSAAEVSARSGVPYSRIYDVLSSLVNKGLITIIPEKTKKYNPASPDAFLEILSKKEKILQSAREKVREMKKFYDVKEKKPAEVALGRRGFYKLVNEMKYASKYEYDIRWQAEPKPEWLRETEKGIKAGKDYKILIRNDKETQSNMEKWMEIHKNIRQINNEGVALSIVDDEEVLIGLIKSDTALLIRDKSFAKIMKKMFLETYKNANEIK